LFLTPLITYLVYYRRRLDTRRKRLLQTLLSLSLDNEYMLMRHGQKYEEWKNCDPQKRLKEFEQLYFNQDFKAGYSPQDYIWPVMLFTTLGGIGWFITMQRIFPGLSGLGNIRDFIPVGLAFGFIGAYFACLLAIFEGYGRYDLDPALYYSVSFRIMFSSFAAYVASLVLQTSFTPIVAAGIGMFPLERTWSFITERAGQALGTAKPEGELGAELAKIQGLEDQRSRQRLLDVGISNIQALATADPLWVFFQTTLPLRTVVDMIDKSILYLYIADKGADLRKHGINGVIELVALAKLAEKTPAYQTEASTESLGPLFEGIDLDKLIERVASVLEQTPEELKAFIYNMYYDPMVKLIYDIWGRYLNRPVEKALAQKVIGPDA
jgi:hypothetical protein